MQIKSKNIIRANVAKLMYKNWIRKFSYKDKTRMQKLHKVEAGRKVDNNIFATKNEKRYFTKNFTWWHDFPLFSTELSTKILLFLSKAVIIIIIIIFECCRTTTIMDVWAVKESLHYYNGHTHIKREQILKYNRKKTKISPHFCQVCLEWFRSRIEGHWIHKDMLMCTKICFKSLTCLVKR